jgi:hypothetical protein
MNDGYDAVMAGVGTIAPPTQATSGYERNDPPFEDESKVDSNRIL